MTQKRKKGPPKNEYQLQCHYHDWDESKFPHDISTGMPDMKTSCDRQKATKKGYMTGYPDWQSNDPRVDEMWEGDQKCKLRFYPGRFIEFKHPNGKGYLSKDQRRVHHNLDRRGYFVIPKGSDMATLKEETQKYKSLIPLYKGEIIIDFEKRTVTYPEKQKLILPPRRGLTKEHRTRVRRNRRIEQLKKKRKTPKPVVIKRTKKRGIRKQTKLKRRKTKKKTIVIEID